MLILSLVLASAFSTGYALSVQQANNYMDGVLTSSFSESQEYHKLDPYMLQDFMMEHVSEDGNSQIKASMFDGRLRQLSMVRRSGDCSIPVWHSSNLTFVCPLHFPEDLHINYTVSVYHNKRSIGFILFKTVVKGTSLNVQVTSTPHANVPSLKLFLIKDIGHMTVTTPMVSSSNVIHVVGQPIREAIVKESTTNLHHILNGGFAKILEYAFNMTPIDFNLQ